MLPEELRLRRLRVATMQHPARRASSRRKATKEPMAIPAMAPLERLLFSLEAPPGLAAADEDAAPPAVEVGNKVGLSVNCGRTTSSHRPVASEPMQQESVAFSELARQ
jgi:hypothetical protein